MSNKKFEERKKKEKAKQTAQLVAAVIGVVCLTAGGFWVYSKMPHDVQQPTYQQPDYQEYQPQYSNSNNDWSWLSGLFGGFGNHLSADTQQKFREAAGGPMDLIGKLVLLGGAGLFIYARSTRRKFLEFDKLGILITDARKRESMSAKFIPWGCLEQVEVVKFDLERDMTAEDADMAAAESSKAVLKFYVDDGSVVPINWRDVVRCVEPGPFINALKTYAPHACEKFEKIAGDAHKVDQNTYTQLWFRYYSTGSERKRTSQLVAGDILQEGRFEVMGQIGGGGQGTAYVAVDKNADTAAGAPSDVVLKEYILPVHRGQSILQATVQKLEQEAAILRKIDHGHIVKLLDSFVEDHRGYLVMEYVLGKSLKDIVMQQGPQSEAVVIDLARQICDVLSYLHSQDPPIIHRDLTPDNLILQDDGILKLVDFNVAHQLESAATATVVGKHCYIPPEQFRGKPTQQSDVYAFGCTLHYLLTGQEPEPLSVSKPKSINDAVSQELNDIVARATALDTAKRYQNVAEMHADVQALTGVKISLNTKDNVIA
jgi:tRNA A-37 threonylcarbamoyl transferase component Bud32